jgi:hypothetical protein
VNSARLWWPAQERIGCALVCSGLSTYARHLSAFAAALCGVSGLACTPNLWGVSGHCPQPNDETPYIQHRHFGAAIALAYCNMFGTGNKAEWDTNTT